MASGEYLHNVMHLQAEWAYYNAWPEIMFNEEDRYMVISYVTVPKSCRTHVGYVFE